jgi:GxxExxY protein
MANQNASNEMGLEALSAKVVDIAFHIHKELGPGLLESVYELILAKSLETHGMRVERQKAVSFEFDGLRFEDALRIDLLVNDTLVVELKSVEELAPVHTKQLLTYLRLMHRPLGLLINFGAARLKDGLKRVVNEHTQLEGSRLRINRDQQP